MDHNLEFVIVQFHVPIHIENFLSLSYRLIALSPELGVQTMTTLRAKGDGRYVSNQQPIRGGGLFEPCFFSRGEIMLTSMIWFIIIFLRSVCFCFHSFRVFTRHVTPTKNIVIFWYFHYSENAVSQEVTWIFLRL